MCREVTAQKAWGHMRLRLCITYVVLLLFSGIVTSCQKRLLVSDLYGDWNCSGPASPEILMSLKLSKDGFKQRFTEAGHKMKMMGGSVRFNAKESELTLDFRPKKSEVIIVTVESETSIRFDDITRCEK